MLRPRKLPHDRWEFHGGPFWFWRDRIDHTHGARVIDPAIVGISPAAWEAIDPFVGMHWTGRSSPKTERAGSAGRLPIQAFDEKVPPLKESSSPGFADPRRFGPL